MFRLFLALMLWMPALTAAEWIPVDGGISPNGRYCVAVYPQETEYIDGADTTVLLVDYKTKKIIGPLEEVNSSGGLWGKTTENVDCVWSKNSDLLLVNSRSGRLNHVFQIYRISGRRAIPVTLPKVAGNPKAKILDVLEQNSNAGSTVKLGKGGSIIEFSYGWIPRQGHFDEDYSIYGLADFDQVLIFVYSPRPKGGYFLKKVMTDAK